MRISATLLLSRTAGSTCTCTCRVNVVHAIVGWTPSFLSVWSTFRRTPVVLMNATPDDPRQHLTDWSRLPRHTDTIMRLQEWTSGYYNVPTNTGTFILIKFELLYVDSERKPQLINSLTNLITVLYIDVCILA